MMVAAGVPAGQVYVSSDAGWVYALDPESGCVRWSFEAEGGVRTAPVMGVIGGRPLLFFGDIKSNAYAVDARTGSRKPKSLPLTMLTIASRSLAASSRNCRASV